MDNHSSASGTWINMTTQRRWPDSEIQDDLAKLQAANPLVHCFTNIVVTGFTANALLAIGAAPAMIIAIEEAAEFAAMASSLLINIGTLTTPDAAAMIAAAKAAQAANTPWALDPVAVGALGFRRQIAHDLLQFQPGIIRGNASEILALAGSTLGGRGVDSTAGSMQALDAAGALARQTHAVVAVSGAIDYITDGEQWVEVAGGDPMMTRVTGTGCALGALMAGFLGAGVPPLRAATAASAVFAQAGQQAAARTAGPGSFAVAFLDELGLIGRSSPG
jgi:hydroxyethylthiazole kinase